MTPERLKERELEIQKAKDALELIFNKHQRANSEQIIRCIEIFCKNCKEEKCTGCKYLAE
jgi:hypothetical protein